MTEDAKIDGFRSHRVPTTGQFVLDLYSGEWIIGVFRAAADQVQMDSIYHVGTTEATKQEFCAISAEGFKDGLVYDVGLGDMSLIDCVDIPSIGRVYYFWILYPSTVVDQRNGV